MYCPTRCSVIGAIGSEKALTISDEADALDSNLSDMWFCCDFWYWLVASSLLRQLSKQFWLTWLSGNHGWSEACLTGAGDSARQTVWLCVAMFVFNRRKATRPVLTGIRLSNRKLKWIFLEHALLSIKIHYRLDYSDPFKRVSYITARESSTIAVSVLKQILSTTNVSCTDSRNFSSSLRVCSTRPPCL